MRKQIALFLFSASLIACTHEDKSDALMAVDLSDFSKTETVNISEFVSDLQYVKLETSDSCLIDQSPVFYVADDYIFSVAGRQIYRFSRQDGRFLGALANRGNGPGEYVRTSTTLPVNYESCTFAAYNGRGRIDYKFDGTVAQQIPRPEGVACLDIVRVAPDLYAGYLFNSEEKLVLFDREGTVVRRFQNPNVVPMTAMVVPFCDFFVYGDRVNLLEALDDTIRSIDPEAGLLPRYCLDWGNHEIELDKMSNPALSRELCFSQKACESDGALFVRYIYQGEPRLSVYDKRNGVTRHSDRGGSLTNDVDNFAPVALSSLDNGLFVGYITAEAFREWAENRPDDWVGNPRLTDLMEMEEMDNPIVVIGKAR